MSATKVLLSAEELNLVQDTHWLLTKNNIIEKAKEMFGELASSLRVEIGNRDHLPESVRLFSPKISKGEYYQGLPYVMLDYPRVFTRDEVFAMRTMFWWGNFFSVTLQLKGSYQILYGPVLLQKWELLAAKGFYVSVSEDEWDHDFTPGNYEIVSSRETIEKAMRGHFLKLAVRIPVREWNDALKLIGEHQRTIMDLLAD
ncbi:MAG TPA: hypothetical protein VGD17_09140 [Chitinophagaceae bacterium]